MKCAHPENKGLECNWQNCPRGYIYEDWEEFTKYEEGKCSYIRSEKWKPK